MLEVPVSSCYRNYSTADATTDAIADANTSGSARQKKRCETIRDVKLYGSLIATASAKPDIIMRGNGQMTKKDKLTIADKATPRRNPKPGVLPRIII